MQQQRPGSEKDVHALFGRKATEVDDARCGMLNARCRILGFSDARVLLARIRFPELPRSLRDNGCRKPNTFVAGDEGVRLHDDPVRRKTGLHELRFGEVREGDVARHLAAPGAEQTMDEEHRGQREGLGEGAAVAAAADAAQRRAAEAAFADAAVAEEVAVEAGQPVVVQRLHHGDALAGGGIIDRRRNQRERVVAMHDVRPLAADDLPNLADRAGVPDRAERERKLRADGAKLARRSARVRRFAGSQVRRFRATLRTCNIRTFEPVDRNRIVALLVLDHAVPGLLEHPAFGLEDAVLPPADAVAVVGHENRHACNDSGKRAISEALSALKTNEKSCLTRRGRFGILPRIPNLFVVGYPSGQRGQTVNLLALPSNVRIVDPPPFFSQAPPFLFAPS